MLAPLRVGFLPASWLEVAREEEFVATGCDITFAGEGFGLRRHVMLWSIERDPSAKAALSPGRGRESAEYLGRDEEGEPLRMTRIAMPSQIEFTPREMFSAGGRR